MISFFEEVRISQPEFEAALQACNKKSALGNDGISNKLIYHSPSNIKSLTLFQFSLKQGHIPNSWKLAKIIMATKKASPNKTLPHIGRSLSSTALLNYSRRSSTINWQNGPNNTTFSHQYNPASETKEAAKTTNSELLNKSLTASMT